MLHFGGGFVGKFGATPQQGGSSTSFFGAPSSGTQSQLPTGTSSSQDMRISALEMPPQIFQGNAERAADTSATATTSEAPNVSRISFAAKPSTAVSKAALTRTATLVVKVCRRLVSTRHSDSPIADLQATRAAKISETAI